MKREEVLNALKKLREETPKRKFTQSIDVQISLKETDVKKPENKVDEYVVLPNPLGRKVKVAALVDKELVIEAKKVFDSVVAKDDFITFTKNKRKLKRYIRLYKYFVAQANIMTDIAKFFGKYLGPKGRMPNPKAGCIVPPNPAVLKGVYDKLQKTVRVRIKDQPTISVVVGTEAMSDDELSANIISVYNALVKGLPRGDSQVSKVYVKMTMSGSVSL